MACCLSPSCCPGRRSARRPTTTKSSVRRSTVPPSSNKSVPSSPATEPPSTARSSSAVPDVVDRLRRRLCQDATDDVFQRSSPCRCCRRCLGEDVTQQPASDVDQSPVHTSPRLLQTPAKPAAPRTTAEITDSSDFMTQFFRNCERIVLDHAPAIHDMLAQSPAAHDEDEQRKNVDDDWTSNRTEPTSSTVEQRRCVSHDDEDCVRSDVASVMTGGELRRTDDEAVTSASYGRTEGVSVERLIAPANSPASAGSLLSSSMSDDVLLATTRCLCSPSTRLADVAEDGLFVRRRPSVSGQSPAAVNSVNWTADRCRGSWRRPGRPAMMLRTSTDNDDDDDDVAHVVILNHKSPAANNHVTSFPVGLGLRPPCLGQECSPIRSTPCGAGGRDISGGSSGATAGTTSAGSASRPRVLPAGRVQLNPRGTAGVCGRRRRRRSLPAVRHQDDPSPAVVRQSYHKVDTWLRHTQRAATTPQVVDRRDIITPENQLKRKWSRADADSAAKRRLTDSDNCSLPSGTFTSDDEDEVDDNEHNSRTRGVNGCAMKRQSQAGRPVLPAAAAAVPVSPPVSSTAPPSTVMTSPRWTKRSPLVDARRRRTARRHGAREEWRLSDVSSGALGDRSSSLATSAADLADGRCPPVFRAAVRTSRKLAVGRRREVLRRVTRMARRLHRVAAADAQADVHVRTLAVL